MNQYKMQKLGTIQLRSNQRDNFLISAGHHRLSSVHIKPFNMTSDACTPFMVTSKKISNFIDKINNKLIHISIKLTCPFSHEDT